MSKYISELMSPQLMGVVYAFVGFIIALYVPHAQPAPTR